jgi:hypothetical protein
MTIYMILIYSFQYAILFGLIIIWLKRSLKILRKLKKLLTVRPFFWGSQDFVTRCIFVAYEIGLKIGSRLLSIPHIGGQQICYQMNDFGSLQM